MKPRFVKFLFLCIGLSALFLTACSAENQSGIEMHRTNAGTPNAQGWYQAKSTYGEFSVLMPCPFNDFTVPNFKLTTGGTAKAYVIGGRSADTLAKFSVTQLQYLEGEPDKKNLLSSGNPLTYHGCAASQQNGGRGRDMGNETTGVIRTIVSNKTVYIMIVEYPIRSEKQVEAKIAPFLDSLQFPEVTAAGL
jgi:hypothetical protein